MSDTHFEIDFDLHCDLSPSRACSIWPSPLAAGTRDIRRNLAGFPTFLRFALRDKSMCRSREIISNAVVDPRALASKAGQQLQGHGWRAAQARATTGLEARFEHRRSTYERGGTHEQSDSSKRSRKWTASRLYGGLGGANTVLSARGVAQVKYPVSIRGRKPNAL